MNKLLLEGKVGIITGGGTGIGEAAAHLFASEGATLVLAGRRAELIEAVAKSVCEEGGEASFFPCDVQCEDQVKALVEFTVKKYGRLDFAFNNAGVAASQYELKPVHETTTEYVKDIININVMGLYYCMKYEIPELLKVGGGTIVNNASNSAIRNTPDAFAYTVSKNAAYGATKGAAIDYAAKNIRINAIAPGITDTPMIDAWKKAAPEDYAAFMQVVPDKRDARPIEQAQAALYLLSDYSSHINGQMLVVDAGQTVQF